MKRNLFIIFLLMIIILPCSVHAQTGNISISCLPTKAKAGEEVKCTITGNSEVEIFTIESKISLSDNLTMESFELDDIWVGSDFETGKIDIYTKSGDSVKGTFNIGVMTIKINSGTVNSDESLTLSSTEFTYDKKDYVIDDVTAMIRVPSNINTLANLEVTGATFTFNVNTTVYDLTVDTESITISATRKDENSTVTGYTGKKTLNYGLNTYKITVTAEDGGKKTYTLNITRPDNRSKENDMLSFDLIGYDIDFDKDKTSYSIDVTNNISKIAYCDDDTNEEVLCISADAMEFSDNTTNKILLNSNAFGLDSSSVSLNVGKNILEVVVVAENQDEKTYTFTINRLNPDGSRAFDELTNNSNTGDSLIIVVCVVAVLSLMIFVYYYKKKVA